MRYTAHYLCLLACFGAVACGTSQGHGAGPSLDDEKASDGSTDPGLVDAGMDDTPDADDAGDDSQGGVLPPRPAREVHLSPRDISTAADPSALELWVEGKQGDLGIANLQELAAAVSVVTWPERQTIASNVETVDASQAGDGRAHVAVAPVDALESRWYAVVVESLPVGFQWWNAPRSRGEQIARFRTDSKPIVSSMTRCDKGGARYLSVYFSELVASTDARTISVEGVSCEPEVAGATTIDSVQLTCTLEEQLGDLTLTFKDTMQRVDKNAWSDVGTNCFVFIPEQLAP